MKRIWWLASYPKSGNTWVRAFLSSLISGRPVDINDMSILGSGIASSRPMIDDALGIESGDLTEDQQTNLRPRAYEVVAGDGVEPLYMKVHDAYGLTPCGEPLFPDAVSAGAIYIVRNPLDVAVSLAHYQACSMAKAVDDLLSADRQSGAKHANRLREQFHQRMGSWDYHVRSWADAPFPVHVVRYEDLLTYPESSFGAVARFLGRPETAADIQCAIQDCSFQNLSRQETAEGYRSNSGSGNKFFRRGVAGAWRDELPPELAARLSDELGPAMQRLGYGPDKSCTSDRATSALVSAL